MPKLGPWELIIILVIVIAIFGAGKIAGLGSALGKGVKDFRGAIREEEEPGSGDDATASSGASAQDARSGSDEQKGEETQ